MRKFVLLLLSAGMFFLTSCFDIVEEVSLNKDGSGTYTTRIDASGLFSNPFMKSALEEAAKQEGGEAVNMEQDSLMYYRDMEGFSDLSEGEKAKVKDLNMRIQMSESKSEFLITSSIPFNSFEELAELHEIINRVQSKNENGGGLMGGSNPFTGTSPLFKQGKRELIRLAEKTDSDSDMDDETMDMAKMFMADAHMTTIYHLPGKVKKCDIPNAEVNGSTVTIKNSLLDMMDKKVTQEGSIKYGRK